MKNFIQPGTTLQYTNSTGDDIAAGAVVIVGSVVGIAAIDIADGESGTVTVAGVFEVAKNVGTEITQGDKLFWDVSAGEVTKTTTDTPLGTAHDAADSSATTVNVRLYPSGSDTPVAAVVAAVATAAATDLTTSEALANQLKTTVNDILTALKDAGLMASS